MLNGIKELIKLVNKVLAEAEVVEPSDLSFDDLFEIYNKSEKLKDFLKKCIKSPVSDSDLNKIYNPTAKLLVDMYIDEFDIEVKYDEAEYDDNNIKMDAMSLYSRDISPYKPLSKEKEVELFKAKEEGSKEAVDLLILHNQRLIISIAKRYIDEKYDMESAIQDGNLGLIKAVDAFDYNRGYKFSTYSTWWIRQSIVREKNNTVDTIRIPIHMIEMGNRYKKLEYSYGEQQLELTDEIAAKELNCSVSKIRKVKASLQKPASLNTYVGDEEEAELGDFIEDDKAVPIEETVINKYLREDLFKAMESLPEREREILIKRFGLDGGVGRTLEDVAQDYNLTRERIRQLEAKALRRMKHPSKAKKLKQYLSE